MRLLLDTHALLWWLTDFEKLSTATHDAIAGGEYEILVSHAAVWEILIKSAKGKLHPPEDIAERCVAENFELLPIALSHIEETARLPLLHGDPFDRMMVAQARCENLVLVSNDRQITQYDVTVLPA